MFVYGDVAKLVKEMEACVLEAVGGSTDSVVFCGHSFGGNLSLAVTHILQKKETPIVEYCFSQFTLCLSLSLSRYCLPLAIVSLSLSRSCCCLSLSVVSLFLP